MEALGSCSRRSTSLSAPNSISSGRIIPLRSSNVRDVSLFFLKIPSLRSSLLSVRTRLRVSAGLERPWRGASKRRNSLREKLLRREPPAEARQTQRGSDPALHSQVDFVRYDEKSEDFGTDSGVDEKREGLLDGDGLGKSNVTKESVSWSKLENWVDQYKRDNEFWGVGTDPIFTVYQDYDGNAVRVSVNEDEILRRSRIEAWSPRFGKEEGESDVKLKLVKAMLIAKEVEQGEYKFPENSSIAKYVGEAKHVSRVDRIRAAIPQAKILVKFYPQIGTTLLVGYFVYWVVKNSLLGCDRSEPTSEEKEMLRRKLKSRKKSNKVVMDNIEVVQDARELFLPGLDKRPELDQNELMKNIIKTNTSVKASVMMAPSSDSSAHDRSFEDKVREIRGMARKARESERLELERNNSREGNNENMLQSNVNKLIEESQTDIFQDSRDLSDADTGTPEGIDEEEQKSRNSSLEPYFSSNVYNAKKPKIIMSVKEAREYLSWKHKIPTGKMQTQQGLNNKQIVHNLGTLNNNEAHSRGNENVEYPTANDASRGEMENGIPSTATLDEHVDNTDNLCYPMDTTKKALPPLEKVLDKKEEFTTAAADMHVTGAENVCLSMDTTVKTLSHVKKVMDPQESNYVGQRSKPHSHRVEYPSVPDETMPEIGEKDKELEADTVNHNSQSMVDSLARETMKDGFGSILQQNEMAHSPIDVQMTDSTGKSSSPMSVSAEGSKVKTEPVKASTSFSLDDVSNAQEMQDKLILLRNNTSKIDCTANIKDINEKEKKRMDEEIETPQTISSQFDAVSDPLGLVNTSDSCIREKEDGRFISQVIPNADDIDKDSNFHSISDTGKMKVNNMNPQHPNSHDVSECDANSTLDSGFANDDRKSGSIQGNNWMEENFEKFDPIVEKIRVGFRENYMMAKETEEQKKLANAEASELGLLEGDEELEWMNDERLQDIVFKVRDNELAGHDPFHLMSKDDEHTFFEGLVKKAEKLNGKLQSLHEFFHSRIENIDYGADGISLYDPTEKIVPRWKGPPIDKFPEFLNNPIKNKEASTEEGSGNPSTISDNGGDIQKSKEQSCATGISGNSVPNIRSRASSKPRTIVEYSDGSSKVGKKGGREHWQHTKKWSRELLELYNAETDPEIKSVMKDMGKGLDKWITEKEIQDVGDLMTRIPKKKRQFIEKKLDKLKREMKMFGPQAVVSKYREYSDEKEEDYLWWLDLKFVLCIELYNVEKDAQKTGFYSLEMAEDLELNPKQYHVIAFEDPGDAKNFCYIMQAHFEMLGKGRAFVVPQPPKDAFRQAKANGFHVTVIRKGEIKLNIDQTLEEVEEEILEIGAKMYHDKIMSERGVDLGTLIKGVFASDKSSKKSNSTRILRKPIV